MSDKLFGRKREKKGEVGLKQHFVDVYELK